MEVPLDLRDGCQGDGALNELRKHLGGAAAVSYSTTDHAIHVLVSFTLNFVILFSILTFFTLLWIVLPVTEVTYFFVMKKK